MASAVPSHDARRDAAGSYPADDQARERHPAAWHPVERAGPGRPAQTATAIVRGWDLVAGRDGPGTRLVLLTAGCPLRCLYCPTPRVWSERSGRHVGVGAVLEQVDRYRPLFELTGGGVTLSGGEPLLHASFVAAMVEAARARGFHLALATPGTCGDLVGDDTLAGLDLVLLDLKAHDPEVFRRTAGRHGGPALRFAERVAALGRPIRARVVIVPGLTDAPGNVAGLAALLARLGTVEHVDVVPFDRAASAEWAAAGLDYPLAHHPGPTHEVLASVRSAFAGAGLNVE